ncbi:hypothetical protein J7E49_10700 [Variovorax paradoxus]|nr:hypothetical protein [Variovorax paradoxus]
MLLQVLRRGLLLALQWSEWRDGPGAFAADGSHEMAREVVCLSQQFKGLAASWFGRR